MLFRSQAVLLGGREAEQAGQPVALAGLAGPARRVGGDGVVGVGHAHVLGAPLGLGRLAGAAAGEAGRDAGGAAAAQVGGADGAGAAVSAVEQVQHGDVHPRKVASVREKRRGPAQTAAGTGLRACGESPGDRGSFQGDLTRVSVNSDSFRFPGPGGLGRGYPSLPCSTKGPGDSSKGVGEAGCQ